ncbi:uncharacterized protein LOC121995216 [Zingiber officinale]|uniref:uncharacterized protein LOC121995216 n=1 Tax=Zingiber officinale TaxID=94328 RepID=UPI001C4B9C82|nr:uncharacterized protein LOC121995216 [Zingiber officinale]
MSRIPKWKIEKRKVKVVFRLQFHNKGGTSCLYLLSPGWDKLFISLIPIGVGKTTVKTNKVNVRNGSCKWPDPIYETTRLLQDAKTKTYDEKVYKLLVATGSSRSSFLGEVNINLADFADALRPSSVCYLLLIVILEQFYTSQSNFLLPKLVSELLETSLASEIEVTVMRSHFCDRMQDSFAQLQTSLQSDFDIIFREKESLIDYINKKNAELEEVQLRAATVEADSNCHMKKYEELSFDLVKRLFENLALDRSVNHEGNSDSDFPSIRSIEQILQDDSFELSAAFQELPNYKDTNSGIDASTVDFTNSPNTAVGVVLPTIADEKSCSYSPPNSTAFKDTESALGQQTKFTDNITDITDIEEHFKEHQKLMSGIGMLQKELEKLRNENLSSLIPLEHQFLSSHKILERDLSQLDLINLELPLVKQMSNWEAFFLYSRNFLKVATHWKEYFLWNLSLQKHCSKKRYQIFTYEAHS